MITTNKTHTSFISKFFVMLVIAIAALSLFKNPVYADTTPLSGYAWSSNIGWISFASSNAGIGVTPVYGVNLDTTTGALSGYAWSSNIGWISFNESDVSGCGSASCLPKINLTSGAVTGWARVVSGIGRTDGWDGYIELSGTNHQSPDLTGVMGVTLMTATGAIKGYAWGGSVVGWILFNARISPASIIPPLPTVILTATPNSVTVGGSTSLSWTSTNATSCTASGDWSGARAISSGSSPETKTNLRKDKTYTLTCTNANGSASDTENVTVGGGGTDPTCPSGNCGEIPNGDSEIQLYLGNTSVLSKTFDSVNPPQRDPSKVAPYPIKKGGTFNMKWVNTLPSDYECTTYARKTNNTSAYGLWPLWDDSVSTSGAIPGLETSSSNINIGTYLFYLTCSDNNPANGLGEEKRSNPVKLQIRQSDIQEI